jgi:uncharacterized protein (UPF0332 family)
LTRANRQKNLTLELEKGDSALRAAKLCAQAALWDDAVSRAYYAAFHHVQAILLSEGLESRSHAGEHHLFHLHFIKAGLVPARVGKLIAALQKFREQADHERAFEFTEAGAREELANAEEVCAALREKLATDGWDTPTPG